MADENENPEALLSALARAAEEERETILAAAEERVRAIEAQTQAKLDEASATAEKALERRLAAAADRLAGEAGVARRTELLRQKHRLLEAFFERLRQELMERIDSAGFSEAVVLLIREACEAVPGPSRLLTAAPDLEFFRDVTRELERPCTVEACECPRGTVRVVSEDGEQNVDNGLRARLRVAREQMLPEIATILFTPGNREGPALAKS